MTFLKNRSTQFKNMQNDGIFLLSAFPNSSLTPSSARGYSDR